MSVLLSNYRHFRQLLLTLLLMFGASPASAEVRALILSANYGSALDPAMHLSNPIVDGRNIANALAKAGVKDVRVVEEAPAERWQTEFSKFSNSLGPQDIALVYYAGHGFQIGGENYLVTADGETLVALDEIMQQLTARAKATILIVDACRENPLRSDSRPLEVRSIKLSRAVQTIRMVDIAQKSRGLAQLGDLRGLSAIVLFSTEPGNVALDGSPGAGSPFALIAAKELARRQPLDVSFRKIAVAVNKFTDGQQSPWRQGDLPFDVYLAGMSDFPDP